MKISNILKEASKDERGNINSLLNKLVPEFVIEQNINLLRKETPKALYSLLIANEILKEKIIFFIVKCEDLINTAIYKFEQITSCKWDEFLKTNQAFNIFSGKNGLDIVKQSIKNYLKQTKNNDFKIDFNTLDLASAFSKLTLNFKIKILHAVNPSKFNEIFSSNTSKFTAKFNKNDFLRSISILKNIRNFIIHNTFILEINFYDELIKKYSNIIIKTDKQSSIEAVLKHISKLGLLFGRPHYSRTIIKEIQKNTKIDINLINLF